MMKKKKKEIAAIAAGVAVLLGGLWILLFLRPNIETRAQLEVMIAAQIEDNTQREVAAINRTRIYNDLTESLRGLSAQWAVAAATLPTTFDAPRVLRDVQRVLYPHTESIHLTFGVSTRRPADLLYSTIVNLRFDTSYWQFLTILHNLIQRPEDLAEWEREVDDRELLGNRVVTYTLNVNLMEERDFLDMLLDTERGILRGGDVYDSLPPEIRAILDSPDVRLEPRAIRTDPEIRLDPVIYMEPIGLHRFTVNMDVEFLTLEPGRFTEAELRAIWAREDAAAAAAAAAQSAD